MELLTTCWTGITDEGQCCRRKTVAADVALAGVGTALGQRHQRTDAISSADNASNKDSSSTSTSDNNCILKFERDPEKSQYNAVLVPGQCCRPQWDITRQRVATSCEVTGVNMHKSNEELKSFFIFATIHGPQSDDPCIVYAIRVVHSTHVSWVSALRVAGRLPDSKL